MSVNIAAMRRRYPDWQHITVEASDYAELSDRVTLQASVFQAQSLPNNPFISFKPGDIVTARNKWASTNAHSLELMQALLIQVLLNTDEMYWSSLWLSRLFRSHMIVSFDGGFYYIILSTSTALVLLHLAVCLDTGTDDSGPCLHFDFTPARFLVAAPRAMDHFTCHDYSLGFDPSGHPAHVTFTLQQSYNVLHYAIRNYITSFDNKFMRRVLKECGKAPPSGSSIIQMTETLCDTCDCSAADKDAAIRQMTEQVEKRAARAKKKREQAEDGAGEEEGEGDDGQDDDECAPDAEEADAELRACVPSALAEVCEREIEFLLGHLSAGSCLNEEETDEGVERLKPSGSEVEQPRAAKEPKPPKPRNIKQRLSQSHPLGPPVFEQSVGFDDDTLPVSGPVSLEVDLPGHGVGDAGSPALKAARILDKCVQEGKHLFDNTSDDEDVELDTQAQPSSLPPPPPLPPVPIAPAEILAEAPVEGLEPPPKAHEEAPEVDLNAPSGSSGPGARPRGPRLGPTFRDQPPGCQFGPVYPDDPFRGPYWFAKLPDGLKYKNSNSRTRTFGPKRTEAAAKLQCWEFLMGAVEEGIIKA